MPQLPELKSIFPFFHYPVPDTSSKAQPSKYRPEFKGNEENCSMLLTNPELLHKTVTQYFDKIKTLTPFDFPSPNDGKNETFYFLNCLDNLKNCSFPKGYRYPTLSEETFSPHIVRNVFEEINTGFLVNGIHRLFTETHDPNQADLIWGRVDAADGPAGSLAFFSSDYFIGVNKPGKTIIAAVATAPMTTHIAIHELDHYPVRGHAQDYHAFVNFPEFSDCFFSLEDLAINVVQESVCQRTHLIYDSYCYGFENLRSTSKNMGPEDYDYWNVTTSLNEPASYIEAQNSLYEHSLSLLKKRLSEVKYSESPSSAPTPQLPPPYTIKNSQILTYSAYGLGVPMIGEVVKRLTFNSLSTLTENQMSKNSVRSLSYILGTLAQGISMAALEYNEIKNPYTLSPVLFTTLCVGSIITNSGIYGESVRQGLGNLSLLSTGYALIVNKNPKPLLLGIGTIIAEASINALFKFCGESNDKNIDSVENSSIFRHVHTSLGQYDDSLAHIIKPSNWFELIQNMFKTTEPINSNDIDVDTPVTRNMNDNYIEVGHVELV